MPFGAWRFKMKLNENQITLLINTLDPSIEYYKDVNNRMYQELLALKQQLLVVTFHNKK